MVSTSKRPRSRAAAARCCVLHANASCSARVTPYCSATFSAVSPIASTPYCASIFGFTKRQPMLVSKSWASRPNAFPVFERTYGARVMLSTPPAT